MCRPSSEHRRVTAAPSRSASPSPLVHQFQPDQQPAAAHVADHRGAARRARRARRAAASPSSGARRSSRSRPSTSRTVLPTAAGSGSLTWVVKNRNPRSWARCLDLGAGEHRGQRQPGAEGLGERQDVGHNPVALEGVPVAGAAQPGLRLVEDQQHAALVALVPQRGEVAGRQVDDPAGAEDRLDQAGGEAADGLGVDHVEAEVELAAPVELPVGVDDVGAEGGPGPAARSCPARRGRSPCGRRCRSRSRRPGSCRARSGRTRRSRAAR